MCSMTELEDRPAPDRLELVRAFVNTRDIEEQTDALTSPDELRTWLAAHDLLGPAERVDARDLAAALAVREALRTLLVANAADEPPAADAIGVLNAATDQYALAPRLDAAGGSTIVTPRRGAGRALGSLLAVMHEEIASGRWIRLKACLEDSCHWAFYDTSRNHSSHWCQMGVCGNRSKNRAYYARRREQAVQPADEVRARPRS
jgi:predicted RNA-binding Zn ribbon-like protein